MINNLSQTIVVTTLKNTHHEKAVEIANELITACIGKDYYVLDPRQPDGCDDDTVFEIVIVVPPATTLQDIFNLGWNCGVSMTGMDVEID